MTPPPNPVGHTLEGAPTLAAIETAEPVAACHIHGLSGVPCKPSCSSEPPPRNIEKEKLFAGRAAVRARISEMEAVMRNYRACQQDRVNDQDYHGTWNVAVNLSETSCYIDGLKFALEAFGG